jgi:DinB superfamily
MEVVMSTNTKTAIPKGVDLHVLARLIEEGYGPGAWHGPDLKAALADVSAEIAFWRPAPERHSIAEIVLHHTYYTRSVRGQLSNSPLEPFVLEGDDWFPLPAKKGLSWPDIRTVLEKEQRQRAAVIGDIAEGRAQSSLMDTERFDIVLGITCHAVYHAGQIQLIKKLRS